jgi:hypothetical protein
MRFQAEIPPRDAAILEQLTQDLQVQSNAELLSNLLSVAAWMVKERRRGNHFAAVTPGGMQKELVVPMFERVASEELPHVDLHLAPEAWDRLSAALDRPPAPPTEALKRLLREGR